jgi:hypothetical protein
MIVTLGSIRGAPGVTSWAVLLAAAWPPEFQIERVVLEADPAGGVLGARYELGVEPGVAAFLASLRRNDAELLDVEPFARIVDNHVWVMPGPETGERARAVWVAASDATAMRLAADRRIWFVDAGRLEEMNPALKLVDASALTVLVVGPRSEDLVQVPTRVESLRRRCSTIALLVCGKTPFSVDDLQEFSRADAVWCVDARDDLVQSAGLALSGRRARRTWAWRQALDVADHAAALIAPTPSAPSQSVVGVTT